MKLTLTKFRFQTGSIKSDRIRKRNAQRKESFDSRLVRLKVHGMGTFDPLELQFRFQTGSIKRISTSKKTRLQIMFRFQTGSIKSGC